MIKTGGDPETVEVPNWRLHDIRRTGATNLQSLGVPVEVTESVVNHISGTRAGVAGIYNRYQYNAEKRLAFDAWDAKLTSLITAPSSSLGEGARQGTCLRHARLREDVSPSRPLSICQNEIASS